MTSPVYFFHGLEGSPQGVKASFLRQRLPEIIIPALPLDLAGRATLIQGLVTRPSWLLGSSLGGLSAILFALASPQLVRGMVLVAPAVGFFDARLGSPAEREQLARLTLPLGLPIRILAARQDEVIPLQEIESLVARSPQVQVNLQVVDDDHAMNRHLEAMWQAFVEMRHEP